MNRRTKIWLGVGALAAVFVFTGIRTQVLKPKTLQDFEHHCMKTADPLKRQEIALAAVDFLVQQGVSDSIAQEIQQAAIAEKPAPAAASEWDMADSVALNDSLWAVCESRLSKFFTALSHLKQSSGPDTVQAQLIIARNLAEKIDTYTRYNYWVPLVDFLNKTDSTVWRRWRAAAISAGKSRDAYNSNDFKLAKFYAICGLQNFSAIPDRRLYLDLCLRLQNAIAYDEADFSIALAFGEWITQECLRSKYYLRAVSMDFNLGDQLYRIGRYDEAIEKIKNVLNLASRWHNIAGMIDWYRPRTYERLSLTLREIGEYQTALNYVEIFGRSAVSSREQALYHHGLGLTARYFGEYEKAEQEYFKALEAAKDKDVANTWYPYFSLATLFLEYNLPEKALKYLEEGKSYVENKDRNFFNNERLSYYLLLKTRIQIKKGETEFARKTLRQAEKTIAMLNSPVLRVDQGITAATLYQNLNEFEEAEKQLAQTLEFCRRRGLFLQELVVILKQAELAMQMQTDVSEPVYPVAALSQVINQLQKIGDHPQLIRAHALLVDAAHKAKQPEEAQRQAKLLWERTEALSRQYDKEERLTFFQHSIYKDIKSAIVFDIRCGHFDSAFAKLSYVKGRALRGRMIGSQMQYSNKISLQKSLQDDEAILDYMVTTDTLYAFVLTRSALRLLRLPENKQKLQAKVEAYVDFLKDDSTFASGNGPEHFRELYVKGIRLSNDLYQAIFDTIAPALVGVNRLYLVPDEFLYAVPFNTLAFQNEIGTRFLIEDKAIMVLPGAWALITSLEKKDKAEKIELFASIDSNMRHAERIQKRLVAYFGNRVDIRTTWKDKNSFQRSLTGDYAADLFYAHAEANWDEPRASWIEIPLSSPNRMDRLSYQEVDSLDLRNVPLVILAGCETSGSRVYLGAGLAGLQRAFLAAGASQVLATYWKVGTNQVADQIPHFLEDWDQHGNALMALQLVQKTAIAQLKNDPFYKYPHLQLWGAYNLTGIRINVGNVIAVAAN